MNDRIAIVGSAQSGYVERNIEESTPELIYRVTKKVLADASMTRDDIDTVVVGSCDVIDGVSISNVYSVDATGSFLKDESKVEEDAAFAAFYAYLRLMSGQFETALVVGWGKGSETSIPLYSGLIFEPFYQRPLGLEAVSAGALQARAYMERYGISDEQVARVAVKNRRNAAKNPYAQLKKEVTLEEVISSPPCALPLRELHLPPVSDGACAIILARGKRAREITDKPVWIKGVGSATDAYHLGYRDLTSLDAVKQAARSAYDMADIKDPVKDIDVAEISGSFPFQEMMLYEALGLCVVGDGGRFADEGVTEMEGELPVNPSGGPLCADPVPATGLIRMAEAYLQVSGKAGERQVKGARRALVHATSGVCLQGNVVYVLEGD